MDSIVLLFLFSSLVSLGAKIFQKLCSDNVVGDSKSAYLLFLAVNALFACGFFWFFGGFRIHLNLTTLIYSLIYAVVVAMSLIANLLVYKYATITAASIIPTGFSLLGSMLIGYAFFSEEIGWRTVVRIALMIAASVLIFFDRIPLDPKQDKPELQKKVVSDDSRLCRRDSFRLRKYDRYQILRDLVKRYRCQLLLLYDQRLYGARRADCSWRGLFQGT